jgi:hypothetical protein
MMRSQQWGALLLATAVLIGAPAGAAAQTAADMPLRNGLKVWVTGTDGHQHEGRLLSFSPTQILLRQSNNQTLTIPFNQIRLVEARDGLGDGARKGALVGAGLYGTLTVLVVASLCDHNCGGAVPFVVSAIGFGAAAGAGIGVCLDAMAKHREVIFMASDAGRHVSVKPMLSPRVAGVRVAFQWGTKR